MPGPRAPTRHCATTCNCRLRRSAQIAPPFAQVTPLVACVALLLVAAFFWTPLGQSLFPAPEGDSSEVRLEKPAVWKDELEVSVEEVRGRTSSLQADLLQLECPAMAILWKRYSRKHGDA